MTRKDETFIIFDFDRYFTEFSDNATGILCISQRDRSLLLSLLRYASWPSRWIGSDTSLDADSLKVSLLRSQGRFDDLEEALTYVERLEHQLIMAECNFEVLASGLTSMGQLIKDGLVAIANKPCCNDGVNLAIVQGLTDDGNTLYGEQSPGGVNGEGEGEPPEGFETWESYFTHKCSVAHFIVDSLLTSMRQLAFIEIVGITVGAAVIGAAIAGCISLGPAGIPILIAALIVGGVLEGLTLLVEDYLEDHRLEIVCALYNSESTQAAIDVLMEYIDEGIAVVALSSAVGAAVRIIALLLAGTDTINQLFTSTLAIAYPDADCSGCEEEEEPTYYFNNYNGMTFDHVEGDTWEADARIFAPWSRYAIFTIIQDVETNDYLDFYITDYELVSGTMPEWWADDSQQWNTFPIPSNFLFDQNSITMDTQGEEYPFRMRFTFDVQQGQEDSPEKEPPPDWEDVKPPSKDDTDDDAPTSDDMVVGW